MPRKRTPSTRAMVAVRRVRSPHGGEAGAMSSEVPDVLNSPLPSLRPRSLVLEGGVYVVSESEGNLRCSGHDPGTSRLRCHGEQGADDLF